jgi:predicted GNAT superfamily acetyltransferase
VTILPLGPEDHGWVLALNAAHEVETSPLDRLGLAARLASASHARVATPGLGFLLAHAPWSGLDSMNFRWFAKRMDDALYIDRVVVSAAARGRGVGAALYRDVAEAARRFGFRALVAEVNLAPPNPVSLAFHARLGFAPVGEAVIDDAGKTVRYLRRELA